ncbi:hypothetical protein FF38_01002 [Lucilia cuprina]|uniref:Uncharacterized protein n=1 Tax=Lucilia cuprina TaxID=7375 RepID=A0A0L0BV81_LUCCU|nr:hypothetical protein FF38_01002 [Lucilia cuprina]
MTAQAKGTAFRCHWGTKFRLIYPLPGQDNEILKVSWTYSTTWSYNLILYTTFGFSRQDSSGLNPQSGLILKDEDSLTCNLCPRGKHFIYLFTQTHSVKNNNNSNSSKTITTNTLIEKHHYLQIVSFKIIDDGHNNLQSVVILKHLSKWPKVKPSLRLMIMCSFGSPLPATSE